MEDFATFCKNSDTTFKEFRSFSITPKPKPTLATKPASDEAKAKPLAVESDVSALSQPTIPSLHDRPVIFGRDNFWNLVFWFGMSYGFITAFTIIGPNPQEKDFPYLASLVFWITVLGVPLLVRYFSKTTYVKDNIFLNSEGKKLNLKKSLPNMFLTVASTIASIILVGLFCDKHGVPHTIGGIFLILVLFGIPSLFFILKNCPISILFNRKFWKFEPMDYRSSSKNNDAYYYDPMYRSYSSNIYHK